jgi:putative ABC transport system permease protein
LLRLIILEALLLALSGALAGCALGWALAQAALVAVGETVGNLFSLVDLAAESFGLTEWILALGSGVAVALLAALIPAWEAIRISPLESARQAAWRPASRARNPWANRLGVCCFCAAPILLALSPSLPVAVGRFSLGVAGMLLFLVGLAFFCPALVKLAVRSFWQSAPRLPGLSWPEARLASDSLRRNPARSGITVATMVISLAAIFTIAAFVNSVRGSLI